MKPFRQLCVTVVLAMSLSVTVLAGEVPCGVVELSPNTPPGQVTHALDSISDTMTEVLISIIQSIFPPF